MIGGLISLIILAAIVFLVIYFFIPDVSVRFFGIAFNAEEVMQNAIDSAVSELGIDNADALISQEAVTSLLESAGNNVGKLMSYLSSPEGQEMLKRGVEEARSGAQSLAEYFSSSGVKEAISSAI